jgi:histidinol-phosphate aminotransferase
MSFFTKKTENIKPYIPGEQPKSKGYIKLNTNENPYPPSRKVIKTIKNMDLKKLRLYPDPESYKLKEVYAKSLGLNIENIFVGNGSDEVLSIAFQTFFADKKDIF